MREDISLKELGTALAFTFANVSLIIEINKFNMIIILKSVQRRKRIHTKNKETDPNDDVSKSPRMSLYVYTNESINDVTYYASPSLAKDIARKESPNAINAITKINKKAFMSLPT